MISTFDLRPSTFDQMNIPQETSMRVALSKIDLFFPYCHSLKEKRHAVHKIKDRIFADFKISIHEVAHNDKWQRAQLGFAVVSNDAVLAQSVADKIVNAITGFGLGEVINVTTEVVSF